MSYWLDQHLLSSATGPGSLLALILTELSCCMSSSIKSLCREMLSVPPVLLVFVVIVISSTSSPLFDWRIFSRAISHLSLSLSVRAPNFFKAISKQEPGCGRTPGSSQPLVQLTERLWNFPTPLLLLKPHHSPCPLPRRTRKCQFILLND